MRARSRVGCITAIAAVALAVFLVPILALYVPLGVAWARCGHEPVSASDFARTYYLPGDPHYRPSVSARYFCTEKEAQAEGYRHAAIP